MTDVALLRCDAYDLQKLKTLIAEGLEAVGFPLESFRGGRVVLKPNLLSASGPDTAVTTHPVFFQAAAELVLDHGGSPILAESPAVATLRNALKATGYDAVLQSLGIEVADLSAVRKLSWPDAAMLRNFEITEAFFDADIIFNLPKFKTHGLTYTTAAVKNLFGAVPGLRKSQMHVLFPDREDFSEVILDLYGAFLHGFEQPKKLVHAMDAVLALEGDGPGTHGTPRAMNAVIAGIDALAVDWVATLVSGLSPRLSPILSSGIRRGLGVSSESEIRVIGQSVGEMRVQGFQPSSGPGMTGILRIPAIKKALKRLLTGRPMPVEGRCTLCYQCEKICPARAISRAGSGGRTPVFDYDACIRCLCCMEACTEDALSLKRGILQWLVR